MRRDGNGRRSIDRDSLSSLNSAPSIGQRVKGLKRQSSRHNLTGVTFCCADLQPGSVSCHDLLTLISISSRAGVPWMTIADHLLD